MESGMSPSTSPTCSYWEWHIQPAERNDIFEEECDNSVISILVSVAVLISRNNDTGAGTNDMNENILYYDTKSMNTKSARYKKDKKYYHLPTQSTCPPN